MTRVALVFGTGAALPQAGIPLGPVVVLLLLVLPLVLWQRPGPALRSGAQRRKLAGKRFTSPGALLLAAGVAGLLAGEAAVLKAARDCRIHLPATAEAEVSGRFLGRPVPGRGVPFRVETGLPGGCRGVVRAVWPSGHPVPATGEPVRLPARWEGRGFPEPGRGEWSGRLRLRPGAATTPPPARDGLQGRMLGIRGRILDRVAGLWPERAPMVEALVLARREHLDPDLRAAFGLSGTAHLLAISGFHVGVVAGLLLGTLRVGGVRPQRAALGAALGAWGYVLAIGAPDAALRASVLLSLLALARLRGRPSVSVGTLSTAFLGLLLVDAGALRSVGFQLSFAGTLGLVTLRAPLESLLDRGWRRLGRPPPRRRPGAGIGERWLRGSSEGLVAGVAATLPTLPLLAWHFDRISLVGIPATLAVAPWVSLAIPGIGTALGLSMISPPAGQFLAGGVDVLLVGVERMVLVAAGLPGSAIWIPRAALVVAGVAGGVVWWGLRRWQAGRVRPPVRITVAALAGATGMLVVPLFPNGTTLDLHVIDVGQGDALALRLPGGGWIAVDAGPRGPGWDAGARRVVPYLRREGVRRLEALVLTHPHLDHLGGAPALLQEFPVRGILDPSFPVPSRPYLEVQEGARARGVWWWPAREGQVLRRNGVRIQVLHPDRTTLEEGGPGGRGGSRGGASDPPSSLREGDGSLPPHLDANDLSVVLLVSFGSAHILLTGDAYAWVETAILPRLPPLTVLKLGHHGSRTSTSAELLQGARPTWALIPVGDQNRYGHPHPEVLERLDEAGVRVLRTDRDGSVRLRIRPDGSATIRTGR